MLKTEQPLRPLESFSNWPKGLQPSELTFKRSLSNLEEEDSEVLFTVSYHPAPLHQECDVDNSE